MKIALFSDWHCVSEKPISRIDNVLDEQGKSFTFIWDYLFANGIKHVLQAGDMVDVRRSWWLLQFLTSLFKGWNDKGLQIYGVMGQHDSYYHNMDVNTTVLGVLFNSGLVQRLGSSPTIIGDTAIYGCSWGEKVPEVQQIRGVNLPKEWCNILVIHKQILMKKFWKDQSEFEYAPDFLHKNYEYDLILCGDAHQKFAFQDGTKKDRRIICNTGPLMRLIANEHEMNHMPGFYVYDTNDRDLKWVAIPAPKGEDIFTTKHLEVKQRQEALFTEFMDKVKKMHGIKGKEDRPLFDKVLRTFGKENHIRPEVMQIIYEQFERVEGK
jgi:hypothetical protein